MSRPVRASRLYGLRHRARVHDRGPADAVGVAGRRRTAAPSRRSLRGRSEAGKICWSNELVLHLIEIKNASPDPALEPVSAAFQAEVVAIDRLLEPLGARLMPTAMHPWMDPRAETRLWPHDDALIYQTYDRIFGCKAHGWANLQSMQLNLPLPMTPSSPACMPPSGWCCRSSRPWRRARPSPQGRPAGFLDFRMEAYRTHQRKSRRASIG